MSNILIINGAKKFGHSNGQLNDTLTEVAETYLRDLGHDVKVVRADSNYDVKTEVQNFLWADSVIWQMPGWWMGAPWTVKKYIDDVFTEGHGALYASDGRTRSDASKKYGSGGLIQGKKYKETAEELNVSVNTVKTLLNYGVKQLRKQFPDTLLLIFYCIENDSLTL